MNDLVKVVKNIPRVSHRVIATNTDNEQLNISKLVSRNSTDFEEFGALHVKVEKTQTKGGMQKAKTYYLNEQQATLLMTYLRNNPVVREFKKALVKEFFCMRGHFTSQQVGGYKSQLAQHSKKITQLQEELKQLRRDIPALEQMGCQRKLELCEAKLREQGVFIPGTLEDLYLVGLGRDYYNNNQEIVNENLKLRKEVRKLRNFKRQISNACDNI